MTSGTRKFITFVVIALVAIAAIVGSVYVIMQVGSKNGNGGSSSELLEISVSQLNKELIEKMGYSGITEVDSGEISGHFDIPEESVTQVSIYISDSSSSATEIACFKLRDKSQKEKLVEAINKHIAVKLKGFAESPKEIEKIKNYTTVSSGDYVFMAISENSDVAGDTFSDIIENKKRVV